MNDKSSVQYSIIAIITSILFSYFVYFGFVSSYTKDVFSEESYSELYDAGVFKYRILSTELVLLTNKALENYIPNNKANEDLKYAMDKSFSDSLYVSYYIVNTFFLVLSSLLLLAILQQHEFLISKKEKLLYLLIFISIISLSQFVVVPYDNSSYFLLILFFYYSIRYFRGSSTPLLIILATVLIIATLNRESSAIMLALFGSIILITDTKDKKTITAFAVLITVYLITYISIRIAIDNPDAVIWNTNRLLYNLTSERSYLGLMTWITLFCIAILLSNDSKNRRMIFYFHLLCLPYMLFCLFTGILFEIRLYIPLFLTSLILTTYNPYTKINTK